jgi:hypothetical protein
MDERISAAVRDGDVAIALSGPSVGFATKDGRSGTRVNVPDAQPLGQAQGQPGGQEEGASDVNTSGPKWSGLRCSAGGLGLGERTMPVDRAGLPSNLRR